MLDAAGTRDRRCVFEVFARHLPVGRRYGVLAGTGRLLEAIADFRFQNADPGATGRCGSSTPRPRLARELFRFTGNPGATRGEVLLPQFARPRRGGHLRRGGASRPSCSACSTTTPTAPPPGWSSPPAAGPMAEWAPPRDGARRGRRAGRVHRRIQAPPATSRPAAPGSADHGHRGALVTLCTTARRMRSAPKSPPSAPTRRCSSTSPTSPRSTGRDHGHRPRLGAHRQRRPAWAGGRGPQAARRSGCHGHRHHGDRDLDEFAIAALRVARVDYLGVGTSVGTRSARRPQGWSATGGAAATASGVGDQGVRGETVRRQPRPGPLAPAGMATRRSRAAESGKKPARRHRALREAHGRRRAG